MGVSPMSSDRHGRKPLRGKPQKENFKLQIKHTKTTKQSKAGGNCRWFVSA
jgi:hypothetical protein